MNWDFFPTLLLYYEVEVSVPRVRGGSKNRISFPLCASVFLNTCLQVSLKHNRLIFSGLPVTVTFLCVQHSSSLLGNRAHCRTYLEFY